MEDDRHHKIRRILNLTLEFICLLTGEDYTLVRKASGTNGKPNHSQRLSKSPIMEPSPSSPTPKLNSDEKMLQLIKKITELLTEEVPVRCQDVSVYFSMEEWEYLEGRKDLYKDTMMEDRPPLTSLDGSSYRNPPERSLGPLYSQDSTQEHQEIPQAHHQYSRVSSQEHHEIPQTHPLYSRVSTQEHHEIPQACPLYSRDSTQEHHEIPQVHHQYSRVFTEEHHKTSQKKVINQKTAVSTPEMTNCASREKSPEVPATEATDGSSNSDTPERCPHLLLSWDSTQEHHEIPQTRPLYSQDSTQEHHEIPQARPLYSRDSTQEHHEIPQARPLYSRDSTQEHQEIPQEHQKIPQARPLYSRDSTQEHQEIPQTRPLYSRDSTQEHHKIPQARPLYSQDSTQEHHEIPQAGPLYSRDSTQEHHEIPQACPLYSRDSTQEHHEIPQARPLYSRDSTQEHHEIPQARPLYSRDTTQEDHFISQKEVQKQMDTAATGKTKDSDDTERIRKAPAVEAPEQSGNSKAGAHHGSITSNRIEANPAMDNSSKTCGDDIIPGPLKDANNASNPKTRRKIKHRNSSDVVGHSHITSNQTEPDAITSNLIEVVTISTTQIEANSIDSNPTEADSAVNNPPTAFSDDTLPAPVKIADTNAAVCQTAITSNQAEAVSFTLHVTEEATISSKQFEANSINPNPTEADSAVDNPPRAFRDDTLPPPLQIRNTNAVVCQTTLTSNQAEADSAVDNPPRAFRHDTLPPPLQIRNTNAVVYQTTLTSNQAEADSAVDNPPRAFRDDILPLLQIWNTNAVVYQSAITSNQAEAGSMTLHLTEEATVSSKQFEANAINSNPTEADSAADNPPRASRDDTLPPTLKMRNTNAVVYQTTLTSNQAKADSAVDNPPRAFRDDTLPPPLQIRNTNAVVYQSAITSNQAEAGSMTLHLTEEATVSSKQFEANAINSNPTEADSAADNPPRASRDNTLPPPLKMRNTNAVVCQTAITSSNQTEADSAGVIPTKACRDDTLLPPLQDTNNVSNSEAMKKNTLKNVTAVVGHNTVTSSQSEANSAVDSPITCGDGSLSAPLKDTNSISHSEKMKNKRMRISKSLFGHGAIALNQTEANSAVDNATTCRDGSLPAPLKDTNNISHSEKMKMKRIRSSKSVVGHGAIALNQTETDSDVDNPTRAFRDDILPAPLKDTHNSFNSEEKLQNTMNNSTAVVDHRDTKTNQTEADSAVDNLTTTTDYTNNVLNFEATKNENSMHSKAVNGHGTIPLTQIKVTSAINNPTASRTDDTIPALLKDTNNISNSETREVRKNQNSNGVVGHSPMTTNQAEAISALHNPTTTCRGDTLPAPLKETNNTSISEAMKHQIIRNFQSVACHSPIALNQTEANSAVGNPTRVFRGATLLGPVRKTHNIFNSFKTLRITITNSTALLAPKANQTEVESAVENPTLPGPWDGNNISNFEAMKNKQIKDSKAVVGHGTTISTNMKVLSALNNPTATSNDDPPPAPSKDTSKVSNCETREVRKIQKSNGVVGHSPIATKQTEANSASNDPTATIWRDDILLALLKDTVNISNGKATKRIKDPAVGGHSTILSNQTENLQTLALNNPTRASESNALPALLKDANNVSSSEEMKDKRMMNSKPVVGHSATTSNRTKGDSALDNPTTCREDAHITSLKDTNNISNSEETRKNELKNSRSVIVYSSITSKQTEADLDNSSEAFRDNTLPASLKDTNNISNDEEKKKNKNSNSVIVYSAITSNPTKVDSALNKPAATCRDHTLSPTLNETNNISKADKTKGKRNRTSTSAVGCDTESSIQTDIDSSVDNPTRAYRDNTLPSLKDPDNISNSKAPKERKTRNSKSMVGHSASTSNQTKGDSAVDNPTRAYRDNTLPSLKDPDNISNSKAPKERKTRNSKSMVGHSASTSNQTKGDSAVDNPTTCRKDSHIGPVKGTNNISNSEETKVDSALNKPAATCMDNTLITSLNDTNNISNSDMTKGEKNRNSTSGPTTSIQTEVDSIVVKPTRARRNSTLPAYLKDPYAVPNYKVAKRRKIQTSSDVVGHSLITRSQAEANSASNNPATSCRDGILLALLKNTIDVSKSKSSKQIKNSTAVTTHCAMMSNQSKSDSALNTPTTDNVSGLEAMQNKKMKNSSVVGQGAGTSIQTEVVDDPTGARMDKTLPASSKDPNNVPNCKATKKRKNQKSGDVVDHSPITTNKTKADSASNNTTTSYMDGILLVPLADTVNTSNSVAAIKVKKSTAVIGYSEIMSNRTKPEVALNNPKTGNVSNLEAMNKRKMKNSSVVARSAITSNQTKADCALDNPTTRTEDSRIALLEDTKHISNDEEAKKNSNSVIVYSAITSNPTEADSVLTKPATTCRDNKLSPPLNDKNNVPISDLKKGEKSKNSTSAVGCGAMTSNQTEVVDTVVDNSTGACRDSTLPASLKDTNDVPDYKATKQRKTKNSKSAVGHSATTSNQTKGGSAVGNPTTCRESSHFAALKDTNSINNDEETKKNKIKNSRSVIVFSAITEVDSALNKPAANCKDHTLSSTLNETNNVSKADKTKGKRNRTSTSAVGCESSNQTEIDSSVDNPTRAYRDNTLPSLKDPDNISNSKAPKERKTRNSKSMVGHSASTSNQTKGGSAVDNPTTCRKDSHIGPLKDTNNISNSEETKKNKMKNSRSAVGRGAMRSNQMEASFALNDPTTTNSFPLPLGEANNVSNPDVTKGENIKNPTAVVGNSSITSIETEANAAMDELAGVGSGNAPTAPLKFANNTSNTEATKKENGANRDSVTLLPAQVGSSLDNLSRDCKTECQAILVGSSLNNPSRVCNNESQAIPVGSSLKNPSRACNNESQAISVGSSLDNSSRDCNDDGSALPVGFSLDNPSRDCNNESQVIPVGSSLDNPSRDGNDDGSAIPVGSSLDNRSRYGNDDGSAIPVGSSLHNPSRDGNDDGSAIPVGSSLDNPSRDCNDDGSAIPLGSSLDNPSRDGNDDGSAIPLGSSLDNPFRDGNDDAPDIDNNLSKSKAPKVKKKKKREKTHKCSECGKLFLFNAHLVVHFRTHSGERPFPCPECGKGFASNTRLLAHQKFHTKEKPYSCTECEKTFYNSTHLQVHQKIHRNERPFSCPECGKTFIHKSNYLKHQEIHMGVKPYLCSYCGKSFRQSSHLRSHQKQHTGDLRFSCTKCRKRFQTEVALISHYKLHRITPFSCPECGKHFINSVSFERHRRLHTGHKLLSCSECGRCFINKTHLSIHLRIHSGEKPFACTGCERKFSDKSACNRHIKTHLATAPVGRPADAKGSDNQKSLPAQAGPDIATKQFPCPECKTCFNTEAKLTKHQKSHPKENPFSCGDCGQRFASKALLGAHQKCHLDKNSFPCPQCDMIFKTQLELETHQNSHPEKEFLCNDCDRRFASETLLAKHQKKHLGNKLFSCAQCKKGFRTQMELDAHEKNHPELNGKPHLGEKPVPSSNGDQGFKTPQELEAHQQSHPEKKSFPCGDCGQRLASKALLAAHQKGHAGKNSFSCSKCDMGFKTQLELETHEKSHPEKEFPCDDCERRFASKTRLAKHQKKHLGNKLFSCAKCKKGFRTQTELDAHEKNHPEMDQKGHPAEKRLSSSDKGFEAQQELEAHQQSHYKKPFPCGTCGRRFTKRSHLAAHQKHHLGEKRFLCLICKKGFKTQLELKAHQKNHPDEKPFLCGDCGRRFASEALLTAHRERHVSKKRYMCLDCGHGFNEKSNFEKHCRIHTGERPYSCSDCGKTFSVKSNMIRHRKIHTGERPYKCLECGKSFRVKSYFIIHQKIHTGVREYSCSQCPKTFRDRSNYQRHKKSHVGGKQFPCEVCGRSFRSPTQLTIHARTHSRQKFECAHCGKNFKNNWCLNKHTKTHTRKR